MYFKAVCLKSSRQSQTYGNHICKLFTPRSKHWIISCLQLASYQPDAFAEANTTLKNLAC